MDLPKYWRLYYKLQEMIDAEFGEHYEAKASGGVRRDSGLPPELNAEANKVASYLMNIHIEKK